MSDVLEEVEVDEQAEYDKVFFGEENEAPTEEVEDDAGDAGDESPTEEDAEVGTEDVAEAEPSDEVVDGDDEVGEAVSEPQATEDGLHTIRWNGKDVKVTTEELINMGQQGFDYTHKSQQLAHDKREHQGELALLERVRSGDKEALALLGKQSGIDPLDILDVDVDAIEQGNTKPSEPFIAPEVSKMMDDISKNPQFFDKMSQVEREIPSSVVNTIAKDPSAFHAVVSEVQSGDYDRVMPQVKVKMASLSEFDRNFLENNPDQFANFYVNVKQSMIKKHTTTQAQAPVKEKKNMAAVGIQKSGGTARGNSGVADSFSSDDAYEAILNRLNNQ